MEYKINTWYQCQIKGFFIINCYHLRDQYFLIPKNGKFGWIINTTYFTLPNFVKKQFNYFLLFREEILEEVPAPYEI